MRAALLGMLVAGALGLLGAAPATALVVDGAAARLLIAETSLTQVDLLPGRRERWRRQYVRRGWWHLRARSHAQEHRSGRDRR